jgi:hypothetical protein
MRQSSLLVLDGVENRLINAVDLLIDFLTCYALSIGFPHRFGGEVGDRQEQIVNSLLRHVI